MLKILHDSQDTVVLRAPGYHSEILDSGGNHLYYHGGFPTNHFQETISYVARTETDQYRLRFRRGELLPLNYWTRKTSVTSSHLFQYRIGGGGQPHSTRVLNGRRHYRFTESDVAYYWDLARPHMDVVVQEAASRAYAQGWDGLTFVSELHKTRAMLLKAARTFVNLVRGQMNMRNWSPGKWNRKLTGGWLEARYGWRILYYDLLTIQKILTEFDWDRQRVSERSGRSVTENRTQTFNSNWGNDQMTVELLDEITMSIRGHVVADFSPAGVRVNPLITAWELTTFSFIFDWIIHIGRMIEAISLAHLSDKYFSANGISITVKRSALATHHCAPGWLLLEPFVWTHLGSSSYHEVIRLPRSIPMKPLLNVNLNALKVLDLLALIFGRVGK
jgi:hypothetical protein